MFAFLGDPQRFMNGPLVLAERRHTQVTQGHGRFARVRNNGLAFLMLCAFLVAMLPLVMQTGSMGDGWPIAKIIAATVFVVNALVVFHALVLAVHTVVNDQQPFGASQRLVLPNAALQQIVLEKWWIVVRRTRFKFLYAAMLNFGAAIAFRQYASLGSVDRCYRWFGLGPCYVSPDQPTTHVSPIDFIFPPDVNFPGVVLGAIALVVFAVLATGLVAAMGILAGLLMQRTHLGGVLLSVALRLGLALIVLIGWSHLDLAADNIGLNLWYGFNNGSAQDPSENWKSIPQNWIDFANEQEWTDVLYTVQFGIAPLADGGVLLAADIMRPYDLHLHLVSRIFSVFIALGLYIFALWVCLRAAVVIAFHRQASQCVPVRIEEYKEVTQFNGYVLRKKAKRGNTSRRILTE